MPSSPVTIRAGRPTVESSCTGVDEPAIVTETVPLTAVTEIRSGSRELRDEPARAAPALIAKISATKPTRFGFETLPLVLRAGIGGLLRVVSARHPSEGPASVM
jgi:hypothetical protein